MDKKEVKEKVLQTFQMYYSDEKLSLPIPIEKIVSSLKNVVLIPYSRYMQDFKITLEELSEILETNDACTYFEANSNRYIIFYNDVDMKIYTSYRYRWSIAHELGHIILGHCQNTNTKLFRNTLSDIEYKSLEEEADWFASYILVPHAIIFKYCYLDLNQNFIRHACKISSRASYNRFIDYKKWLEKLSFSAYDEAILNLTDENELYFWASKNIIHYKWCSIAKRIKSPIEVSKSDSSKYKPCSFCNPCIYSLSKQMLDKFEQLSISEKERVIKFIDELKKE